MFLARKFAAVPTLVALLAGSAPAEGVREEYEVKAAFLLNFARFIEWPAGALRDAHAPIVLCSYGEDPFDGGLAEAVAGKKVNGHPLEARQIAAPAAAADCQVVFVPDSQNRRLRDIATATGTRPVLVVGESKDFAERGGMINFVVREEHVRFEINPSAASAVGLKISSKLLQLATIVQER